MEKRSAGRTCATRKFPRVWIKCPGDIWYLIADCEHIVYLDLRRDWKYMPVFWNCHDLAIRLAHLIVPPSLDAVRFLRRLMALLHRAYLEEINWFSTAAKVSACGWGAGAVGTVVAIPPLAAVGAGVFMVGWSVGFFGSFVHDFKVSARNGYMRKLEERFPALKALHG